MSKNTKTILVLSTIKRKIALTLNYFILAIYLGQYVQNYAVTTIFKEILKTTKIQEISSSIKINP